VYAPNAPRPLTVAYIVPMGDGLHSFVYREIRELLSMGVNVHLFPTKTGPGPYEPSASWPVHSARPLAVVAANVRRLVRCPKRYTKALTEAVVAGALVDFALGALVADLVERHDVHLVHCHFGDHKFFIGHFVGQFTHRPVTVTIHAYELYNNPNPKMFRYALLSAAAIVTVSEYNRRVLEREYQVPPDRIRVIPLFAYLPEGFSPRIPGDRIIILTVARLVEKKGHHSLMRALSKLPQEYEAWIVGQGPLDVRAMAKAEDVENRVRVLGRLDDAQLQEVYRAATIFCLPSETTPEGDREGIPVALMEAMAHGLPVVATRHAGIPELVEEILVDQGDTDKLAGALLQLGRDPGLRARLGRRNREIVAARFSRRNVLLLKALFEALASTPSSVGQGPSESSRNVPEAFANAHSQEECHEVPP